MVTMYNNSYGVHLSTVTITGIQDMKDMIFKPINTILDMKYYICEREE